jgi:hypothetical protein
MSEFKCPHPDCEDIEFNSEGSLNAHYGAKHKGSLAKKTTTCSTDGCTNEFEYYPSEKSGKLCENCTKEKNHHLTKEKVEYIDTECAECDKNLTITETRNNKYNKAFCGEECRMSYDESERVDIECGFCEEIFSVLPWVANAGRKFCGQECQYKNYSKNHSVETSCHFCQDSMQIRKSRFEKNHYNFCDPECYTNFREDRAYVELPCDECGEIRKARTYRRKNRSAFFCSPECRFESMKERVSVECSYCGENTQKRPSEVEGVHNSFCSKPCRLEFFASPDSLESYGRDWIPTRRKVRRRDDYECQICGKDKEDLGKHPSAHHIKPVHYFVENDSFEKWDAHYKENLVLLCEHHHTKVEYGIIDLEEHIDDELVEKLELENPVED